VDFMAAGIQFASARVPVSTEEIGNGEKKTTRRIKKISEEFRGLLVSSGWLAR
jgi:hypothetical protein